MRYVGAQDKGYGYQSPALVISRPPGKGWAATTGTERSCPFSLSRLVFCGLWLFAAVVSASFHLYVEFSSLNLLVLLSPKDLFTADEGGGRLQAYRFPLITVLQRERGLPFTRGWIHYAAWSFYFNWFPLFPPSCIIIPCLFPAKSQAVKTRAIQEDHRWGGEAVVFP